MALHNEDKDKVLTLPMDIAKTANATSSPRTPPNSSSSSLQSEILSVRESYVRSSVDAFYASPLTALRYRHDRQNSLDLHRSISVQEHSAIQRPADDDSKLVDSSLIKISEIINHLRALVPGWSRVRDSEISFERLRNAMTNYMLVATTRFSTGRFPRVLVRIYGKNTDVFFSREKEIDTFRRLSIMGFSPRLLGRFAQGRFEEFLHVTQLSKDDLRVPETARQIARRMCEMHHLLTIFPAERTQRSELWGVLEDWYFKACNALKELSVTSHIDPSIRQALDSLNFATFEAEIQNIQQLASTFQSPVRFCHNDSQYGNLLRHNNAVIFVDYEYSCVNFRGFDIGNHFYEYCADYTSATPHYLQYNKYPTIEEQLRFLISYLREEETITNAFSSSPEDFYERVLVLLKEVHVYGSYSHLWWGFWGLIQSTNSSIEFDYLSYGIGRLQAYRNFKSDIASPNYDLFFKIYNEDV